MKSLRPLAWTLTLAALTFGDVVHAAASSEKTVTPHSVPLEFASARYSVAVNGQLVSVFSAAMNLHFASFDFTGSADVEVTINDDDYNRHDGKTRIRPDDFWQGKATVRPLSRAVRPTTEGRVVRFTVTQSGQYSVERPGTGHFEDEVLFLFANPPEKNVPLATDPKVIWLGPGIHQRSVDLKSDETLYLALGAVLFGGINIWNAERVRICGRGTVVYSGPQSPNFDTSWKNEPNWHPLTTHAVRGLTVEGVTFVGRSRGWTIQLGETFDAAFENIKIITSFPANLNGDGMDWYGGGRTTIRDSFFRVADDCFCVHTAGSSVALRVDRGGGGHLPGAKKATPETSGEVGNITIERCVFWPTVANIFRAGWINQSLTTHDITVRDCDIIHIENSARPWMGANSALFTTVSTNGKGPSTHRDYLFEKIRIEEPAAVLGVSWAEAHLENFRFKDIAFTAGATQGLIRGSATGLSFENVTVSGRPANRASDLNLTYEGEVRGVEFQNTPPPVTRLPAQSLLK